MFLVESVSFKFIVRQLALSCRGECDVLERAAVRRQEDETERMSLQLDEWVVTFLSSSTHEYIYALFTFSFILYFYITTFYI